MATIPRPETFRIEPVTEPDAELAEILKGALSHDGTPLNIFGVLGRHPKLLKRFNLLGGYLLNKGLLPERERELVILRVGANASSRYEFAQHLVIGKRCGLTEKEIAAVAQTDSAPKDAPHGFSDDDLALIALADDLHADDCVSDSTWTALATRWTEAELVELLVVAGFYRLVSGFLNSAGVELEPGMQDGLAE